MTTQTCITESATVERIRRSYWTFTGAACAHAMTMMMRHKRIVLAAVVTLAPVIIPVIVPFLNKSEFTQDGTRIFTFMMEQVYLIAMAPLLALFFGCMLIGEDIEQQTIPYILTRAIPRSALVLGRFAAYALVSSLILVTSIVLTFTACTAAGKLTFSPETITLLAHYAAVGVASLLGYGALTTFLGAISRRPIIIGLLFMFGWQRLAMAVPGAVDFLTIEKYLKAMFPVLATERQTTVVQKALWEVQKKELLIEGSKAAVILAIITATLIILTCLTLRYREYSQSKTAAA